ncbi:MAG: dephospho-CoA kinase [Candidatus Latescibacterota bacterium]|nr:dephospho-CoA kinase [Candidatus Latescibacterota bacterium]
MVSSFDGIVIGVTGAMGSGKSTVSGFLKEWGSQLVDADLVAHEIIEKPQISSEIERQFGSGLVSVTGKIRRSELGARVFNNHSSLKIYYDIIKDPLTILLNKRLEAAKSFQKIVVFDAPLLFEWGLVEWVDVVVSVCAERELCIRRVMDRSSLSRCEIEDRMSLQLDPVVKRSHADYFIENNDSIEDLRKRTKVVWNSLKTT